MSEIVFHARCAGGALRLAALCAAGLLACTAPALQAQTAEPQKLPVTTLTGGLYNIKAEVARTPQEHAIGLMWRTSMGANEGMLFIFPDKNRQCFWMKNTLIPLDIAFVEDDGRIVNLDGMQPRTETPHCSAQPVRYVLEMNKGWFAKRGLKAGDRLGGPPFSPGR